MLDPGQNGEFAYVPRHCFPHISACAPEDWWVIQWSLEKSNISLEILFNILFDVKIQPMVIILTDLHSPWNREITLQMLVSMILVSQKSHLDN